MRGINKLSKRQIESAGPGRHSDEAALAHIVGDKAEQAYRRGAALDRRRELMTAWADYCTPVEGNVVRLRG